MSQTTPSWFAADRIFEGTDGWYIGSPNNFCVGPYAERGAARAGSQKVRARLARARNVGEMLRIVRTFVNAESNGPGTPPANARTAVQRVRSGEAPRFWFRSDRCFASEELWFFSTREGIDVGPYESRDAAARDARRLARLLRRAESAEQAVREIREFMARPVGLARRREPAKVGAVFDRE